jgi:hypothetical protein
LRIRNERGARRDQRGGPGEGEAPARGARTSEAKAREELVHHDAIQFKSGAPRRLAALRYVAGRSKIDTSPWRIEVLQHALAGWGACCSENGIFARSWAG